MTQAADHFTHLPDWKVVICKQCRVCVWPSHVAGHLRGGQHKTSSQDAEAVADQISTWQGVEHYPSQFVLPETIQMPIPEIPLWEHGERCQVEPDCRVIGRNRASIRRHWHKKHPEFCVDGRRGGSSRAQGRAAEARYAKGARQVQCQRLFAQGPHSQYIEVQRPEEAAPEQVHAGTAERAIDRAWQKANIYWESMREKQNDTIQAGQTDEVNPWLKRTGWIEYLEGCDRKDLLKVIVQPGQDEEEEEDPVEAAVWKAMGRVAMKSQHTVGKSGVMLRMEAIRTEMYAPKYTPLQGYQEEASVDKHCQPWQQMLMFFIRTRKPHRWTSPTWRFSRRQDAAFKVMIAAAEEWVQMGGSDDGDSEDGGEDSEDDDEDGSEGNMEGEDEGEKADDDDDDDMTMNPLEKACMGFCIELLNQRIHNREYDMALVCGMAVLGVAPLQGGFRDPETYPPILSSIIKIAHFMVVQHAEHIARPVEGEGEFSRSGSACDFEDSGYESQEGNRTYEQRERRRQDHRSSYDWVCRMMNTFMVRGTGSPAQWLLDLRAYGLKIHYNATAPGHVSWTDGQTLGYKSLAFSMDQFRQTVHELRIAARRALFEDLLFAEEGGEVPEVPWARMYDDPVNGQVGWNFIRDQRTRWPVDGGEWLFRRIQNTATLRAQFARPASDTGIDHERFRDYMRQVIRFRGMLLILMHLSGGQPARGPEILSVRHRNTTQGGHRNLFIEDGAVVFVTRYHKGAAISGDVKIIHRYLPREVGELVVWYLWLALPFIQRMEAMLYQKEGVSDHMWPADGDGTKWTTDRMKKELQRVSKASMGQAMTVAAYRQIAIAISRQHVRGATQFHAADDEESEEWRQQNTLDEAADEQATHSPDVAGRLYARNSMEMSGSTADNRQRFRAVSTDWHRFLAFESTRKQEEGRDLKRKRNAHEDSAAEEQIERRERLQRMDAEGEMRWMMRKEVTLRSAQGEAMRAIQDGESFIVAVMPTGAGKSMLFMLPAFVEAGGMSIVVVPLRALRKDMIFRCEKLGIKVGVWSRRDQCDGASIVLVTPEKAADEEFATFVKRSKQTRRLDRIVIDECHVILNDQSTFRPYLQRLGRLASAETQMVLLTATLPPTEEERLFERMYWKREEVRLIRASTVRKNIRYRVVEGGRTERERMDRLESIVGEVLRDPEQPQGKVVVMCESKPKVKKIVEAGLFPCEAFHADIDEERKEETLTDFREGKVRTIVATGAFGMGIDIPDIRLIVHVDNPRNMMDYGQASGRGGRDGLMSQAIIIRGGRDFEDELIGQYIDRDRRQCRRMAVDGYLDGDEQRQRCAEGEEPCDVCTEQSIGEGSGEATLTVLSSPMPMPGSSPAYTGTPTPAMRAPRVVRGYPTPSTVGRAEDARGEWRMPVSGMEASSAAVGGGERDQEVRRMIDIQDRERGIPQARRVAGERAAARVEDEIREQMTKWKGVCAICRRAGKDMWHAVSRCASAAGREADQRWRVASRMADLQTKGGRLCFKCTLPKTMCEKWEDGVRDRKVACPWYGILWGVVYGVRSAYVGIWEEWIARQREEHSIEFGSEEEVDRWLGKEDIGADHGGIRLLSAFMWLTKGIEREEREGRRK